MRILITGGAGLIGSSLIHRLNALDHTDITIVDRLGSGSKWRNLVGLRFSRYLEINQFLPFLGKLCEFDVVFHMGAASSTRTTDASYLMDNNLDFSVRLCQWASTGGKIVAGSDGPLWRTPRFIYASSAATYGLNDNQSDRLSPDDCRPVNPYALSKNLFDQWAARAGCLDKIVGLKYFNVFGPNSRHKGVMTDFIAKTYDDIKRDGYTTLFNTHETAPKGKDARDFLYAKDAADITAWFALDEKGRKANGLFNVGSGNSVSWREVATAISGFAKPTIRCDGPTSTTISLEPRGECIRYQPMPPALKDRYQYYTNADISKLRAAGYDAPITPIEEAIADYAINYLMCDKRLGEVPS